MFKAVPAVVAWAFELIIHYISNNFIIFFCAIGVAGLEYYMYKIYTLILPSQWGT